MERVESREHKQRCLGVLRHVHAVPELGLQRKRKRRCFSTLKMMRWETAAAPFLSVTVRRRWILYNTSTSTSLSHTPSHTHADLRCFTENTQHAQADLSRDPAWFQLQEPGEKQLLLLLILVLLVT